MGPTLRGQTKSANWKVQGKGCIFLFALCIFGFALCIFHIALFLCPLRVGPSRGHRLLRRKLFDRLLGAEVHERLLGTEL